MRRSEGSGFKVLTRRGTSPLADEGLDATTEELGDGMSSQPSSAVAPPRSEGGGEPSGEVLAESADEDALREALKNPLDEALAAATSPPSSPSEEPLGSPGRPLGFAEFVRHALGPTPWPTPPVGPLGPLFPPSPAQNPASDDVGSDPTS